jgi:hypothetical protein
MSGIDQRLAELAETADASGFHVIGADVEERPLHPRQWTETYRVDSWLAGPPPVSSPIVQAGGRLELPRVVDGAPFSSLFFTDETTSSEPPPGSALIVRNNPVLLAARWADWAAVRPDIAQVCGWVPALRECAWKTADGEVAVVMMPWADGHLYRRAHSYEDTVAQGWHVMASDRGLADLERLGGLLRHVFLKRTILVDEIEQKATRTSDLPMP